MAGPAPGPVDFGREVTGRLEAAEAREWLCTNGIGGFASGTIAGVLTRRYHGLLVAALRPPLGRTLLVAKLDETVECDGSRYTLCANRWADGTVDPHGYLHIERFHLDGSAPVWTFACGDLLLERRVWMEQGSNTTYVRYEARRRGPVRLALKLLANHRDFHATTRGDGWRMRIETVPDGLAVTGFDGARAVLALAPGALVEPAHDWYRGFALAAERERGLDWTDDHLHAGTLIATLEPGQAVTVTLSAEAAPDPDGDLAWRRRQAHDAAVLRRWRRVAPARSPAWIDRLVLAADQFVVRRPRAEDPISMSIIAGYPWFGDWGRDTMVSLPGLIAAGQTEAARRILATFAGFVDRGMLPNTLPDSGAISEYNTVDAGLWYFEALAAYHRATGDDHLVRELYPVLADMLRWHRDGTRYGIGADPADGLLRSGEAGVQLTWMDARVGDWVVTPRTGKAVEINALWLHAHHVMAGLAPTAGKNARPWEEGAAAIARGFERFWNEALGYCYDVLDGPDGADPTLRPNQILAVSLEPSPLTPSQCRAVVDTCARWLHTSFGPRSLDPRHPFYRGVYHGGPGERDSIYHQGTAWSWLLGPFALAHFRVYGDRAAALDLLTPMRHHLQDYGLGSIAEIFDGDPPFSPRGSIAQAWSVAEVLRAWCVLAGEAPRRAAGTQGPARR